MRRTQWLLALAAGYVDGICLLFLGGVFGSVVTGNLVVLGVSAVQRLPETALRGALSVAVYGGTALLARRIAPSRCLVGALLALCTLCGGWMVAQHDPRGLTQLPLLALAAIATGLQHAAARDPIDPTTAPTSANLLSLACIPVGAVGAALLLERVPWVGPLPAVLLVAIALVVGSLGRQSVSAPPARHREPAHL
ncbi:YoaK family protein [Dactylosporangium sp. NPDC049525]|uniref:YoaK family protein n=1 Tax=Dactylosporangium sp. NPDC049525 TaxID=3154730 RepID=UPI00344454CD